ncbi:Uncharacterised protein [Mycoplasmopsis citelli]|uniref:Uncharacterized protein n=1 Tax=Mycoplasmopsis citelli TaxID=171281 RepID=A0A449B230_9BACT|nr:DUF6037 family protein [Mycoplasmopsis citelli]VEU74658.1 Uncharacterised protein [Mycoplasmopsis citelli]
MNINIIKLIDDMNYKEIKTVYFKFNYKNLKYYVSLKKLDNLEPRFRKDSLYKLTFSKREDISKEFICESEGKFIWIGWERFNEFREYFGIELKDTKTNLIKNFASYFFSNIPNKVPEANKDIEKFLNLSKSDSIASDDPRKIYCIGVRRNSKGRKRTEFNLVKTKLLKEKLYNYFKDDDSISFLYSRFIEHNKTVNEILDAFTKKLKK